jgi:hypothetical protein
LQESFMPDPDINSSHVERLSPLARQVLSLNLADAYGELVPTQPGDGEARRLLEGATPQSLLSVPIASADDARALLAGLWLWHDYLEESHRISQSIENETGSFWHAIMHRREGDFSNAKYWYARCSDHPILPAIAANAGGLLNPLPAEKAYLRLTAAGQWSGGAFVDLVEQASRSPNDPRRGLAVSLQQLEWRMLFEHCTRAAAGR